jgi:hypothetical protein
LNDGAIFREKSLWKLEYLEALDTNEQAAFYWKKL